MKSFSPIILTIIVLTIGASNVFAFSCIDVELSERFREAKAIFIGQIPEEDIPEDDSLIQGNPNGVVLEVVKAWKGVRQKYISVELDFSQVGMYQSLYRFEDKKQYLVFAYGKDLKVNTSCSDTKALRDKNSHAYEDQQKEIKKLNSFWFRFWNTYKPFYKPVRK